MSPDPFDHGKAVNLLIKQVKGRNHMIRKVPKVAMGYPLVGLKKNVTSNIIVYKNKFFNPINVLRGLKL